MKIIYSLFGVLFSLLLFSQEPELGEVRFAVEVDNGYFEIEINDTMLLKKYKTSLPPGNYSAKVWSPGYDVKEIEFTTYAGKLVEQKVEMSRSEDYMRYESEYKAYRKKFHTSLTIPLSAALTTSIFSGAFMIRTYQSKKRIYEDIDLYKQSASTSEIQAIKNRVDSNVKSYNRQRAVFFIGTGVTALLTGWTIWSGLRFKRDYKEPTYDKTSPFANRLSVGFTPYGCGLTFKL